MISGWLYDGESAVRRDVLVETQGDSLLVRIGGGGDAVAVPRETLHHVETRRDCEVYGRTDLPGWRLGLSGTPEALARLLPKRERYGRLIDRIGLGPAVAAGIALSALVIFVGFRFPEWVAPYFPRSWEKTFGDSLVGDFGGKFCAGPGGQAALDKLARRLSPQAGSLNLRVVHVPVVNAAALPGGNIVIFDELLKKADGPDELAGILAHEIAHVERRHTTQAMIRELGLGIFISAFGGNAGSSAETLIAARYSRGAETQADDDAVAALRRADISPLGTATFFDRLANREARIGRASAALAYLSTHPMSAERRRKFRASALPGHAYRPALDRDDWQAISNICVNDPDRDRKRIKLFL